jgi:alpha-glucan phosphorylase-like protein
MIAYFCAEYSLDARLRTYAGGLGILAGDTVKEMGDQGIPFVGIGLYYYKGYLAREYDWYTPESADLQLLKDAKGNVLTVCVPIGGRDVYARAWIYQYKTATIYLLDTMLHQNHPMDQQISYYLYDQDIRIRLAQEMMLGIGGVRLLKSIGLEPQTYHMNEGHSAFLYLEAPDHVPIVFTNHTVIAEGNHMYEQKLIQSMFERYFAEKQKCSQEAFLELGACEYPEVFSMTNMAIKIAKRMNGVSMLHTRKLEEAFPDSKPIAITNGIHIPTWFRSHAHHTLPSIVTPRDLRHIHDENKKNLLLYLRHMSGTQWDEHTLILGWARRIIQYSDTLSFIYSHANTLTDGDSFTHTHAHQYSYSYRHIHSYAHSYHDPIAYSHCHTLPDTNHHSDSDHYPRTPTHTTRGTDHWDIYSENWIWWRIFLS